MGNFEQEMFLINWFGHYQNKNLPMPVFDTPQWIAEGVGILSHIENVELERKKT
jgi:hypothetical protein